MYWLLSPWSGSKVELCQTCKCMSRLRVGQWRGTSRPSSQRTRKPAITVKGWDIEKNSGWCKVQSSRPKSGQFFVIMCDIDSGAAGPARCTRACNGGGGGARAGAARQTDRQQRASSREIGTSLGLGGTWGRRLSSREREPVVRSPPPNKNSGEIVCSVRRMLRPKWRLHPRVQWARTQSVPGATSAMWCVKWRRGDDPLRRPCTSDIDCSRRRNPMHPARWPSTSQHPLPPVWPQGSRFPDKLCTAYLKVGGLRNEKPRSFQRNHPSFRPCAVFT